MEAQLEYVHVAHKFLHVSAPIFMISRGFINKKFLHRSSVGSLLRVRCWLGFLSLSLHLSAADCKKISGSYCTYVVYGMPLLFCCSTTFFFPREDTQCDSFRVTTQNKTAWKKKQGRREKESRRDIFGYNRWQIKEEMLVEIFVFDVGTWFNVRMV